jgi:hypothetical protein
MPYWHVTGKEARYGQHAICLDQAQFESLTRQVEDKVQERLEEKAQEKDLQPA